MKMDAALQRKVEDELGVEAIPEEHPVMPKLKEVFGDHTFFLGSEGLNIVESDPSPDNSDGKVVKLATWSEDRTELKGHEPQLLPVTIDLAVAEE